MGTRTFEVHEGHNYIHIYDNHEFDNPDNPVAKVANLQDAILFAAADDLKEGLSMAVDFLKEIFSDFDHEKKPKRLKSILSFSKKALKKSRGE